MKTIITIVVLAYNFHTDTFNVRIANDSLCASAVDTTMPADALAMTVGMFGEPDAFIGNVYKFNVEYVAI